MYKKAVQFAIEKHQDQTRRNGVPYITHPIAVATNVRNLARGIYNNKHAKIYDLQYTDDQLDQLLAIAVLHDTIEDCNVTHVDLSQQFNKYIADGVAALTNDASSIALAGKTAYMQDKLVHLSDDLLLIKLCDRLDNVSDAPTDDYKKSTISCMAYLLKHKNCNVLEKIIINNIIGLCMNNTVDLSSSSSGSSSANSSSSSSSDN